MNRYFSVGFSALLVSFVFSSFIVTVAVAGVVDQGEHVVQTKLNVVRLSVEAKCRTPQFEDDPFTVRYSKASYSEISKYKGYSVELIGRTCGQSGAPTELSYISDETVEVLLYDYATAEKSFKIQVRQILNDAK